MERERDSRWKGLGVRTVAVGPGGELGARTARAVTRVSYPLLADPRHRLYDAFGFARTLGFIRQSGVVVVNRTGVVRMIHRTAMPGGAFPVEAVDRALRGD